MTLSDAPAINFLDPAFYVDPFESYRWLRDHSAVHWDPIQQIWGVARHADVLAVEKNPALYSSFNGSRPRTDQRDDRSMINQDDPGHQRQRMLVARRFTPRSIRAHEDYVRGLADRLIDGVSPSEGCEVVEAVASRLPAMVIGELLGYPEDMWPLVRRWSEVTMLDAGRTAVDGTPRATPPQMIEAMGDFATRTLQLIGERRAEPRDDLLSVWIASETDGVAWDDRRVLEECILLLDGGAETTRTVIGSIVRELALRPDVQTRLRTQPELLSSTAVEEFIRWVTPISNMRRTVTADSELSGTPMREGDEVVLLYGSANRDERVFKDPDDFDVTRPANHHVAFGFGTHVCLGASLARLELRVVFEQLLARLPPWRLVPGAEPHVVPATFTRGYDAVHIEFDTSRSSWC